MEPLTTTTAGAVTASVGLMALLIGMFGPVGADVMLVIISAIAGCSIALSANKGKTLRQAVSFLLTGLFVGLSLAWAISSLLANFFPVLSGPYTPSIIAFCLGFGNDRIAELLNKVLNRAERKIDEDISK